MCWFVNEGSLPHFSKPRLKYESMEFYGNIDTRFGAEASHPRTGIERESGRKRHLDIFPQ